MPNISEASVYEALGLEVPAEQPSEGANEQTSAESVPQAETTETAGENEQTVAESAPEDVDPQEDPVAEPQTEPAAAGQSMEERRANAARRRQQEQQAAVDAAVKAEREKSEQQLQQLFERAGMKNTYTGETIKTMEEFQKWDQQYRQEQLQRDLAAGKLTQEGLNQIIDEHPIVKQAAQVVQQRQAEQQRQSDEAFQKQIDNEIAQIGKLDPGIRSVQDLLNMPNSKEFYQKVQQGYSFFDAYRLVNFDAITRGNAEAARTAAMNNTRGKEHLQRVGASRGDGAISVPSHQIAMYRAFNPNASEADIQAHYNKYKKNGGS